ncbi:MAG TPA: hypothetical protein VIR04_10605 [Paralcaligenes sp.]|jgi:hypothetical protein
MATVYSGKRPNLVPGQETFNSQHMGTAEYLRSIRAEITPGSEQIVDDKLVDGQGRYVGADGKTDA